MGAVVFLGIRFLAISAFRVEGLLGYVWDFGLWCLNAFSLLCRLSVEVYNVLVVGRAFLYFFVCLLWAFLQSITV